MEKPSDPVITLKDISYGSPGWQPASSVVVRSGERSTFRTEAERDEEIRQSRLETERLLAQKQTERAHFYACVDAHRFRRPMSELPPSHPAFRRTLDEKSSARWQMQQVAMRRRRRR